MGLIEAFSIGEGLVIEIMLIITPIWTAFFLGLVIGWIWRPKWWENMDKNMFDSFISKIAEVLAPSNGLSSLAPFSLKYSSSNTQAVGDEIIIAKNQTLSLKSSSGESSCSSSKVKKGEEQLPVNEGDLEHLYKVVEEKDGGPSWIQMMDRSTPTMSYRAWRRDPETGPPQYRSSTIFEDATPEMVKDFFWDDEFRPNWDNMLIHSQILEESQTTGTMIVQWVRKFPFFCSDREYIIGRRIWEAGRTYYCVTKGVPNSVPRKDKPRRVDLYYSSWCIRPVESRKGTGQMTACEVLLFHHEDMGIPWEIAKLGVRQGMWGAVKKIDPGLRAYQKVRSAGAPLSPSASMAQITTKVDPNYLNSLVSGGEKSVTEVAPPEEKQQGGMNMPKLFIFGGAVALACSLDRGLLTKAVIFGVARRIGRIGGKL